MSSKLFEYSNQTLAESKADRIAAAAREALRFQEAAAAERGRRLRINGTSSTSCFKPSSG